MATTEALLIGRRRDLAVKLVGGFAVAVGAAMLAALAAEAADLPTVGALVDRGFPLLLFYAPAPIAAAGAYARCGGPACLAVGVVPATVLAALLVVTTVAGVPGIGSGAAVGGLIVRFALVGVTSAFVGFCAGVTAALVADVIGVGSARD
ncbi:hypothetical protein GRS48_10975 [Halorubrum sp. JWXQ-INN 858]|uniref:hypothetical protein n=1 Tax=Halorubrum sp. JWXQ-INN 858 TaxID=2690782 RepID=UPI00135CF1B1|nr:hypothetical protein [Halorubrum sp. JWXQ-INN 858]MWV65337.1 hypothetical protein [Halorubrum sp. JWXQ-INN 858]